MAGGASGPEAFTLLLRLLMTHFDGIDTEEGYTKLHIFVTARLFLISVSSFAYLCRPLRGVSVFCLWGRAWCWRWFGWRRMSNFRLSCLRCTLGRRQRTRGHTPRWMLYGGLLVTKRIIRHLPSTAKHFFSACFFDGSSIIRPAGARPADHRRGQGRVPSQSISWQTESSHHPTVMPIDDSSDPQPDHTSNCWPLEEHHCAEVFAVNASFKTDDPPLLERPPFTSHRCPPRKPRALPQLPRRQPVLQAF